MASAAPPPPVLPSSNALQPVAVASSDQSVVVSTTPACASGDVDEGSGGEVPPAASHAWLAESATQQRVLALNETLREAGGQELGLYPDHRNQTVVIVFPTTFKDYEAMRQRLAPRVFPLKVVLRPACFTPEQIEEARKVVHDLEWHPRAKHVPNAGHFDASVSAFVITIHDSAPEVAAALEKRLGPLVRVRLGKPRPGTEMMEAAARGTSGPAL